jgi:hypothetical protein
MASTVKHLRSSTADKRPTASGLADGQLAINTASGTPGLFLKDNAGAVVKVGPVHVGAAAPNATPAGSSGNSKGELWVNDTTTIHGLNYYTGSAFVNLTPSGTATTAGLVELATNAETQAGTDTVRAVTPSGLQSKVSDSTSTTSSTTIASSTAVKAAFDLANAALPKSGGRVTGNLEIGPTGSLSFEGSTDDNFETFLAVVDPTADRTITFPNVTGTVVTTGDTGTVTSTMITDGTIVNADINASAGIVDTKLATISTAGKVSNSATTAVSTNTVNAIVTRDGSGNFSAGTITANLTGTASAIADNTVTSAKIVDGAIVNVDVNVSAAIAGTKISPNFGSQNVVTTGTNTAASLIPTGSTVPTNGVYLPSANTVGVATNGVQRVGIDANGLSLVGGPTGNARIEIGQGATENRNAFIDFVGDTTYADYGLRVIRGNTGENALSQIQHRGTGNFNIIAEDDASITFRTTNTERLRITSAGLVGIGTSSPGSYLEVAHAGAGSANLRSVTFANGIGDNNFKLAAWTGAATNVSGDILGSLGLSFTTTRNSFINFHRGGGTTGGFMSFTVNNDSEAARITAAGNVGIGATTPRDLLHLYGAGQTTANIADSGTRGCFLRVSQSGSGAGAGGGILFASEQGDTTNSVGFAAIKGLLTDGSNNTAGALAFSVRNTSSATSLQEAFRIDSSGRLLVGTSSALSSVGYASNLQVQASSAGSAAVSVINTSNDAFSGGLINYKSRGSSAVQANDGLAQFRFTGYDGTAFIEGARIAAEVDGTPGTNDMPGRLVFSTTAAGASSPTERMRITNQGQINLNTTSGASISVASGTTDGITFYPAGGSAGVFQASNNTNACAFFRRRGSDGTIIDFRRDTTSVGSISVTTTNTAYNTSSDYRLKENVVDLDGAIDRLKLLPVHRFNFIADPDTVVDGFIAHEAAEVVPECVTGNKDEIDDDGNPVYQGIDQSKIVPLLTAALQEAIAKIETLEQRLTAAGID